MTPFIWYCFAEKLPVKSTFSRMSNEDNLPRELKKEFWSTLEHAGTYGKAKQIFVRRSQNIAVLVLIYNSKNFHSKYKSIRCRMDFKWNGKPNLKKNY